MTLVYSISKETIRKDIFKKHFKVEMNQSNIFIKCKE